MHANGLGLVEQFLACPVCGLAMAVDDRVVRCESGHTFDIARQGYVSLFGGGRRANTGDTPAMVQARADFLAAGHYAPIAQAVSDAIPADAEGLAVDLAGGTGYYLSAVLERHPQLVGLDIDLSTYALRRAAGAHDRLAAVAADVWQPLPVQDAAARVVLSIFGPRNAPEIRRILPETGRLIVVTPTAAHLGQLVGPLGMIAVDALKQQRLDEQLAEFQRLSQAPVEYTVQLVHRDILNEVLMGPSAHHVDADALRAAVGRLPEPTAVTISVSVAVYAPR
ncbi:putative RNA methyltransferase [Salinibacterium sp. ZJ454]|uniref:putative RNA methyltransferase n=1 Tax=Salinibacterium sp. ZJ454 TaxID=2708339 RepID=UPI001AB05ECB|nr:rRNA (guanine-N1)-methyltransferase [Salinibacterium sp. ZJ454]